VACTSTVSSRGVFPVDASARGEDFYLAIRGDFFLATSGDTNLATRGDSFMATDSAFLSRQLGITVALFSTGGATPASGNGSAGGDQVPGPAVVVPPTGQSTAA
jgi:hypothetical protein